MIWDLCRVIFHPMWTLGILYDGLTPLAVTCEEAWRWNRQLTSCIPPGSYSVQHHNGPKFKDVFIVEDVPERSGILIHVGNTIENTEGCILVGQYYKIFGQTWGVANSTLVMDSLKQRMINEDEWVLRVHNGGTI